MRLRDRSPWTAHGKYNHTCCLFNPDIYCFIYRELLANTPGVRLVDNVTANRYPMPINATRQHDVEVGRIRQSLVFGEHGLDLFVSGDQLLRGAALNAVLIAEAILDILRPAAK